MPRIEILTEEPSMQAVLENILPKIVSSNWALGHNYFIRAHEGKSDLQKSIPRKIKVFSHYHEPAGIIIIHDQDANDCKVLKRKLSDMCVQNGDCPVLVRIACRELEAWFLGDMQAIQTAYPRFKMEKFVRKDKFRNPDNLNAAEELKNILPEFQKIASAKAISKYLSLQTDDNKSESFRQFIMGVSSFFQKFEKFSNLSPHLTPLSTIRTNINFLTSFQNRFAKTAV